MRVLVLGGGGREHALIWALRKSPEVQEVVCAPGNAGIAALARCVAVDPADVQAVVSLALAEQPDLVVVGPEVPLAAGVVDALEGHGIRVFGPTQAAARLETSKAFSKGFMARWQIPTAAYAVCGSASQVAAALTHFAPQVVVKGDGLAAGKGVVLCDSHAEAEAAAAEMLEGSIHSSVVLEELLEGPEISFFTLCDGTTALPLAAAQDHKRIGEGDTGPNTGGMGAYSTDQLVSPETQQLMLQMAQRVVDGMRTEGVPFRGVLFTGFMLTADGPKVLEFNTRFGDPETEAVLLRLQTPLLDLLQAAVNGTLRDCNVKLRPGAAACVIAASAGYPGTYQTGRQISGLDDVPAGVEVFHSGTALRDGAVVTAGGRVLAVSAAADSLPDALTLVYAALSRIEFEGMQFRRDIGWRALG